MGEYPPICSVDMYWILTRSRKWVTVEPLLFLSVFSNFIAYPTTVQLVYDLVCVATPNCSRSSNSNLSSSQPPAQVEQEVQTVSSHILLFSNLALGVPSAFVSFVFGHFSDSRGRKTFILLACMMSALSKYMMMILVYLSLDVYFVVLANFLDGCGGSFPVLNLLFYAYIADISTTTQRTSRVGILESMFYFAATLGGLLSGIIIQNAGYGVVYLLAMASHVVAVLYVVLALPESVNSSSRGRTTEQTVDNPRWKQLLSTIWSVVRNDRLQAIVCVLFLVIFFSTQMIFLGLNDIDYLFVLGPPLSWSHELLGYFAAYMLGLNGIATLLVLPLLSWCRINDYVIVCIGLFSGILLLVGIGISTETWHMFVGEWNISVET